jgi:hypothetical protein
LSGGFGKIAQFSDQQKGLQLFYIHGKLQHLSEDYFQEYSDEGKKKAQLSTLRYPSSKIKRNGRRSSHKERHCGGPDTKHGAAEVSEPAARIALVTVSIERLSYLCCNYP